MHIKENIEKITSSGTREDMEHLADIFRSVLFKLKDLDEECFNKFKMEIHEIANGKIITREMAEEWVNSMKPAGKWDFETTSLVKKQYNITDIDDISFYIVMNMLYSDMSNIFGNGETNDSISRYIQGTRDWLGDPDVSKNKLYIVEL